jgi:hypothetical protein
MHYASFTRREPFQISGLAASNKWKHYRLLVRRVRRHNQDGEDIVDSLTYGMFDVWFSQWQYGN